MSESIIISPRKLIEVALPLDAINEACAREKSIRHGHPSTLHLWWARRPLAAARAVIFSQLVNDPAGLWECQNPGQRANTQQRGAFTKRRQELFKILEDLVLWENTTNEVVLDRARAEIRKSWKEVCELNSDHPFAKDLFDPEKIPGLHDPFAGGGAIPLEAQRLGLEANASDLNPVAVLINKAMIEIPPKFVGRKPLNPDWQKATVAEKLGREWPGAKGMAEDVRFYGAWLREEAQKRIGHLYPDVKVTEQLAKDRPDLKPLIKEKLTVIAWLWTRTAKCPNPSCGIEMPLLSSFVLSSKENNEAYIIPSIKNGRVSFDVSRDKPTHLGDCESGYKRGTSAIFECAACGTVTTRNYIADYATTKGLGTLQTAIVCDGPKGRIYLPASCTEDSAILPTADLNGIDIQLSPNPRDLWCRNFGLNKTSDLFTQRQLIGMTTFCDLVTESRGIIENQAVSIGMINDAPRLGEGGSGAGAYADAISIYLAFAVSKIANIGSTGASWMSDRGAFRETFARQAIPLVWDFVESNPFAETGGGLQTAMEKVVMAIEYFPASPASMVEQANASTQTISSLKLISTDPPYYDNISYADLSDFFYVWLRRSLKPVYPALFSTMAVPKKEELVAAAYRHETKNDAEKFFLEGMREAMRRLTAQSHPIGPITIYYAFKQSETKEKSGTSSTGWETFLEAVVQSGLQLSGTWPLRTEGSGRIIAKGTNALASSIVLVCRKRPTDACLVSRRDFIRELNSVLPEALEEMTKGSGDDRSPVAPVDLSQAIIGPGMAVFSKYAAVLEADGSPMSVRTALQLINRFLAEDDFDADTQFCLSWFEQNGWKDGPYGDAETLARGKGTSVDGVKDAGVIQSGGGKVRLYKWSEYPADWNPLTDNRTPIWEALHHLIRALKRDGGETASGALLAALGGKAEAVRQLAYRLYTLCERLGQAEDARAYNELITSWTGIETAAAAAPKPTDGQLPGFENN